MYSIEQPTIKDIDVEEGNESKAPLSGICRNVPFLDSQDTLDGVESHDLLEEVEVGIADGSVREVGNRGRAWPGDDGDEQDTKDDSTLNTVHHQHDCENTAAEDTNPHGRVPHLVRARADASLVLQLRIASCKFKRCGYSTRDKANTSTIAETNDSEVETNSNTGGELDTGWDSSVAMISIGLWTGVDGNECAELLRARM